MEVKAFLEKPYTEEQRINFIVENNHQLGYEIQETDTQLQALGLTEEEKQEQERQAEIARKSKLKMTKQDFFLYFIRPLGIAYSQLMGAIKTNDLLLACYEGCNHIYRYDENFIGNVVVMVNSLLGEEHKKTEEEILAMLDEVFEEHNAKE